MVRYFSLAPKNMSEFDSAFSKRQTHFLSTAKPSDQGTLGVLLLLRFFLFLLLFLRLLLLLVVVVVSWVAIFFIPPQVIFPEVCSEVCWTRFNSTWHSRPTASDRCTGPALVLEYFPRSSLFPCHISPYPLRKGPLLPSPPPSLQPSYVGACIVTVYSPLDPKGKGKSSLSWQ